MKFNLDISAKRWFMGKGRSIKKVSEQDSTEIGDTRLLILKVEFEDGSSDLYTAVEDENRIGQILEEAFAGGATQSIFQGSLGYFVFRSTGNIPTKYFKALKPVSTEQSNSAFFNPGKIFFKLYRRLQPGPHPEAEVLEELTQKGFARSPRFYGSFTYKAESGQSYTLGILEEHLVGYRDAWAAFNAQMDTRAAKVLGIETARMHRALQGLKGSTNQGEHVPFEKLRTLLQESLANGCSGTKQEWQTRVLEALPQIKADYDANMQKTSASSAPGNGLLSPQRIHGDYHLGQVLLDATVNGNESKPSFMILDFEGEPTRPMEFRRALRSPAVDIAGMLRSFRYAAANSGLDSQAAEQAFVEGYSQESGIGESSLRFAAAPYITAKAVYEASYELEFRPSWFHIPAAALVGAAK